MRPLLIVLIDLGEGALGVIKAIETTYKGYRFRSRLEARWAVFFDHAQIQYEYEAEGYELESGARYLPDFYLPEFGLHVEIKPSVEMSRSDLEKLFEFGSSDGVELMLIAGSPTQEEMLLITGGLESLAIQAEIITSEGLELTDALLIKRTIDDLRANESVTFGSLPLVRNTQRWELIYKTSPKYPLIQLALLEAKQARFER